MRKVSTSIFLFLSLTCTSQSSKVYTVNLHVALYSGSNLYCDCIMDSIVKPVNPTIHCKGLDSIKIDIYTWGKYVSGIKNPYGDYDNKKMITLYTDSNGNCKPFTLPHQTIAEQGLITYSFYYTKEGFDTAAAIFSFGMDEKFDEGLLTARYAGFSTGKNYIGHSLLRNYIFYNCLEMGVHK